MDDYYNNKTSITSTTRNLHNNNNKWCQLNLVVAPLFQSPTKTMNVPRPIVTVIRRWLCLRKKSWVPRPIRAQTSKQLDLPVNSWLCVWPDQCWLQQQQPMLTSKQQQTQQLDLQKWLFWSWFIVIVLSNLLLFYFIVVLLECLHISSTNSI